MEEKSDEFEVGSRETYGKRAEWDEMGEKEERKGRNGRIGEKKLEKEWGEMIRKGTRETGNREMGGK